MESLLLLFLDEFKGNADISVAIKPGFTVLIDCRHLNGCSLDMFNKPSLLITDAFNANYSQEKRKTRDGQLLSKYIACIVSSSCECIVFWKPVREVKLLHLFALLSLLLFFVMFIVTSCCYHYCYYYYHYHYFLLH